MRRYSDSQLKEEINKLLDDLEVRNEPLRPQWITHEICRSHRTGLATDDDSLHVAFWIYTGYATTRKVSTECINARAAATSEPRQSTEPLLPYDGFEREYLQDHYVVNHDGEDVGVPTRELSDEELLAKAILYRGFARANLAHARELERYVEWRREQQRRLA
jgi:hypothetical protein